MNRHNLFREDGQSIIMVAISISLLLGFVALSVDIGSFYGQRRAMQNAADAGALAGARELCFGTPANWQAAALDYAQARNGAPAATATLEGTNVVHVTTSINAPVFFAPILGATGPVAISAEARAACSTAISACGLWPVGFFEPSWNAIRTDCGREFALWGGGRTGNGSEDNVSAIDCTKYDCDLFKGSGPAGQSDILDGSGRAWLDFTYSLEYGDTVNCDSNGCGASEIGCWIRNDSGAQLKVGACIAGTSGVKAGVKNDVDTRQGDVVRFPIYSGNCGASGSNCDGGFQLSGFGCGRIVEWMQGFKIEPLPAYKSTLPDISNAKVIKVTVACGAACSSQCGTAGGGGLPGVGDVGAVSLR